MNVIEIPAQAVVASREERLKRLVNQYGTSLLRMCYAFLKDLSLAEDATQETFLKAFKNLDKFVPQENWSEKTWLMRIATNTCRDIKRSAWFRHIDRRYDVEEFLDAGQLHSEQSALIEDVLSLPSQYREVLFLYYYQDLTVSDISKILEMSEAAIYKRLERARQKLRVKLERGYLDE